MRNCPDAEVIQIPVSDGGEGFMDAFHAATGGEVVEMAVRDPLMGKLPVGVLKQAGETPVCLIAGKVSDKELLLQAGFAHAECINPPGTPLEEAMQQDVARQNIAATVSRLAVSYIDNSNLLKH